MTTTKKTLRSFGLPTLGALLTLILLAPGCQDHPCDEGNDSVDPLVGHWLLTDEMGEGRERHFERVEDDRFYDTRFRQQYIFREDGSCRFVAVSAAGEFYWSDGTWQRDPTDPMTVHITSTDGSFSIRIVSVTESELILIGGA